MFPIAHFIKGFLKNLFNPKISKLAFVSANNQLDKSVVVYRGAKIKGSLVGRHSYIGNNTDVENAEIGSFCSIADHCRIGMASHTLNKLSTSPIFTLKVNGCQEQWADKDTEDTKHERTILGNDVWIGSHVLVKGGVHIGNGACVAAGAVVVKDVPPYAIVGGVPAKVIRYRFPEDVIAQLEKLKWWNLPDEELKEHIAVFQKENMSVEDLEKLKAHQ